jgi:protein phosphatase
MQQQNHYDSSRLCLKVNGASDVGRKRALNEDHFCIDEALRLFMVADGMGGHVTGEVASQEAVEIICNYVRNHQTASMIEAADTPQVQLEDDDATLKDFPIVESGRDEDPTLEYKPNSAALIMVAALEHANQHLHNLNRQRGFPEGQGMGTTIAGIWLPEPVNHQAIVFHIGDSRIYLYRTGKLQQLSRDHTLYQYWKDHGQVGAPPARNIIFRSLGPASQVTADIQLQDLHPDDLILICSDGLNAMVPDTRIEMALHQAQPNYLQSTCEELVAQANAQGGIDNITVILACCNWVPS